MKRRVEVITNWSRLIQADVNKFLKSVPPAHISKMHMSSAVHNDGDGDHSVYVTVLIEYCVHE